MLVLLLLVLSSRKQLADLAADANCCTNDDEEEDITTLQKPLTIALSLSLSVSLAPHTPSSFHGAGAQVTLKSWSTKNPKKAGAPKTLKKLEHQ
jgi:hypothetical protein